MSLRSQLDVEVKVSKHNPVAEEWGDAQPEPFTWVGRGKLVPAGGNLVHDSGKNERVVSHVLYTFEPEVGFDVGSVVEVGGREYEVKWVKDYSGHHLEVGLEVRV